MIRHTLTALACLPLLAFATACGAASTDPSADSPNDRAAAAQCADSGGTWRRFTNGCRDLCDIRPAHERICTMDTPMGCDCGPGRCWDGAACTSYPGELR